MPRINYEEEFEDSPRGVIVKIKAQKPRNPLIQEIFESGKYRPRREDDKRRQEKHKNKRDLFESL